MAKNILVVNPYYSGLYGEAKPEKYLFMPQVYASDLLGEGAYLRGGLNRGFTVQDKKGND